MISFTRPGKRYVAVQHVFRIRLPFPQNPRRLKNIWFEDKKHVFSWKVVNWGQLWRGHHQPCKLHAVHVLLRMKCVVSVHATQQVFKKWQTSRKMDRADRGTHHWRILCVSTVKIWKQQNPETEHNFLSQSGDFHSKSGLRGPQREPKLNDGLRSRRRLAH